MLLHYFKTTGGKNLIYEYIDSLSKDERIDGYSVLKCLEDDKLDELTIKPWQGKISEVYFYKHNRIFYVITEGKNIYLLHSCRKQKNKTEKNDGEIVIKRAKIIGEALSRKFI
jgi:phage-related protein